MDVLGIDIGGSGIKGAIVNTSNGELLTERQRLDTPAQATPDGIANSVAQLVQYFNWHGPIGCGFPAAIQHGVYRRALAGNASSETALLFGDWYRKVAESGWALASGG